jgi:hypothetical protein
MSQPDRKDLRISFHANRSCVPQVELINRTSALNISDINRHGKAKNYK